MRRTVAKGFVVLVIAFRVLIVNNWGRERGRGRVGDERMRMFVLGFGFRLENVGSC